MNSSSDIDKTHAFDILTKFQQILQKIAQNTRPEAIIEEFILSFSEILHADSATVVLWESNLGFYNIMHKIPSSVSLNGVILTPDQGGLDGRIYRDKRSIALTNYSKSMDVLPQLKGANFQFAMGTPLYLREQLAGSLCFYFNTRTEKMTSSEESLMENMARYLCIAILNAQISQKLEEKTIDADQSRSFLDLLLNSSPDIIFNCDLSGKIKFWNKAAEVSMGYSSQEMMNQKPPFLQTEEDRFHLLFLEARKGTATYNEIFQFKTSKNEKQNRIINLSMVAVRNSKNYIDSILFIGQDISEKQHLIKQIKDFNLALAQKSIELTTSQEQIQKMQEDLILAEKLATVGQLSDKLSHQINNPTMGILNNARLILDEIELDKTNPMGQKIEDSVNEVIFNANRVKNTLKALALFSEATRTEHYRPTDVLEVINQSLNDFKDQFTQEKIKIAKKVNRDVPSTFKIEGNFLQLKRVLRIILSNAITALEGPNRLESEKIIKIMVEKLDINQQSYIRVMINDNGIGIAPEQIDKIFTPFYTYWEEPPSMQDKVNPPQDPDKIHTGLGLVTAQIILQNHHAHISVKSKVQKGTTFVLDFPEYTENLFTISSSNEPTNETK